MKPFQWQKLGRIFDPSKHKLPGGAREFAQSPQVLVLPDRVRVFFSTRVRDTDETFVARVAYADFDTDWNVLGLSDDFVISPGDLGCYDEHGIFPLHVFRDRDRLFGFIGGFSRRTSVPIDGAIGLAASWNDGITFERIGKGPVLAASPNEPFLILDPYVQKFDNKYHMWYIFGTTWIEPKDDNGQPERVYKIGHAISDDCMTWQKLADGHQIVSDILGSSECQALPTVIRIKDSFHMVFCFREAFDFRRTPGRGYRLGHAWSMDLKTWTRSDESLGLNLSTSGWDSEMMCYPNFFELQGHIFLAYNGNEFGRGGFGIAKLEAPPWD